MKNMNSVPDEVSTVARRVRFAEGFSYGQLTRRYCATVLTSC
jgi:hypothetical protein